ncbi:glutathione peroxidase 7-like isoform X1 [Myxocyprinus asiaticus]|uniref:glutathione peroxidase 7-like isoform X1 n=1 Tax=Myxocyprinus asiaticus TaxID=70543 RepID=UPI0022213210|nr:glutathione peroxidase 7-like isoform X1 [Myxocyprinus asiaticus]
MEMILRALTLLSTLLCLTEAKQRDFYTFKVVNSRGRLVSLDKYRGSVSLQEEMSIQALDATNVHVSLVVNVASECGYTDEHYKDLQQLQKDFGPFHFNVLAFPCNQFGQQEPGSDKEIDSFVRRVYGASFPIFSKIAVVGIGANNAYKYLVETSGKEPTWNFWKYLIDTDGKVVDAWGPTVSVKEIRPQIADMVRKLIIKRKEEL